MELIGKWRVAKMLYMDPETFTKKWETPEDLILAGKVDDEYSMLLISEYDFCADGTVNVAMPIPDEISKEEIDAAVSGGEICLYGDNMLLLETKSWKEENGRYYYDTGIEGSVGEETVSPWIEIVEEDGMIELMTLKLVRCDV